MTCFFVRAENDFSLMRNRLTWFLCGWSKLTLFLYVGRKSLGFSVSIESDFGFVCVVAIDLISTWGVELDMISV